jgi:esterase/lipase
MKYFSGFSLLDESCLFEDIICKSDYSVVGFSYGAIKAIKYVEDEISMGRRVDTLQLLSPAFFQTKDEKFKRLQTISFKKDKLKYMKNFIKLCFLPYSVKQLKQKDVNIDELTELLYYTYDKNSIRKILNIGVRIEVYLGSEDTIIDVESARKFFLDISSVTYIKGANHFLQTGE